MIDDDRKGRHAGVDSSGVEVVHVRDVKEGKVCTSSTRTVGHWWIRCYFGINHISTSIDSVYRSTPRYGALYTPQAVRVT